MLHRHRSQNESWLKARAVENDREKKELYTLRVPPQSRHHPSISLLTSITLYKTLFHFFHFFICIK